MIRVDRTYLLVGPEPADDVRRAIRCCRPSDAFKPMLLERLAGAPA